MVGSGLYSFISHSPHFNIFEGGVRTWFVLAPEQGQSDMLSEQRFMHTQSNLGIHAKISCKGYLQHYVIFEKEFILKFTLEKCLGSYNNCIASKVFEIAITLKMCISTFSMKNQCMYE